MIMKRLLTFVAFAVAVAACKEPRSWCPVEVSVPFVSADIPDTVDARQVFTADFVLDKGECIKEYGVKCNRRHDTIWFLGAAIQDYCDKFPDTAKVEKSVRLSLGDSSRYVAIYDILIGNDQTMSIVSASKIITTRR